MSSDDSRYGHSSAPPDPPAHRPALPAPRPPVPSDGPLTVGSLLRREGRAAHSQDRPVVPRARDAVDDGHSAHRTAVTAGALLAVTAVLGTNAVSGVTFGPGADADGPDLGRAVVPAPLGALSLSATAVPLGHAMAALEAAGSPVLAAMDERRHPGGPASGAGIVAQALGGTPFAAPATFAADDGTSGTSGTSGTGATDGSASEDVRSAVSRAIHRSSTRHGATGHSPTHGGGGSDDGGSPSLHVPPVLVDPGAGSVPAPPPVVEEGPDPGGPSDGAAAPPPNPGPPAPPVGPAPGSGDSGGPTPPAALGTGTGTAPAAPNPAPDPAGASGSSGSASADGGATPGRSPVTLDSPRSADGSNPSPTTEATKQTDPTGRTDHPDSPDTTTAKKTTASTPSAASTASHPDSSSDSSSGSRSDSSSGSSSAGGTADAGSGTAASAST